MPGLPSICPGTPVQVFPPAVVPELGHYKTEIVVRAIARLPIASLPFPLDAAVRGVQNHAFR
jgi:hypothetical protein